MTNIHEIALSEVLLKLPDIRELSEIDFNNRKDTFFLCGLGFEDRCTTIPEFIAENTDYKCKEAIYFEYSTNQEDNGINEKNLVSLLESFSSLVTPIQCDSENFSEQLRQILRRAFMERGVHTITFDISVCSSKLLLSVLKILFEFDVDLQIVYTEAKVYHPTKDEANQNIDEWKKEEDTGLTMGVSTVLVLKAYSGRNVDYLPELLVGFLTFKPERIKKIISYVDEALFKDHKRVIWIVGRPHLTENEWRINLVKEINKEIIDQTRGALQYTIPTFSYRETLKKLYEIYEDYSLKYHINVAPLGSKLQLIGVALFHYMKPDVTIVLAPPQKYDAEQYSEGYEKIWKVDFGRVREILSLLDSVGIIKLDIFGGNDENK